MRREIAGGSDAGKYIPGSDARRSIRGSDAAAQEGNKCQSPSVASLFFAKASLLTQAISGCAG